MSDKMAPLAVRRWQSRDGKYRLPSLQVGWKHPLADGGFHVFWWGSTENEETLALLVADLEKHHGLPIVVERDPELLPTPEREEQQA